MRHESGSSLIELLVVVAVIAIAVASASLYLRPMEAPVQTGESLLEGFFNLARSRAMSTTSAYRVFPLGSSHVAAEWAGACSDTTWTEDPDVALELPRDVTLADTDWSVCFSSRGIAAGNQVVILNHPQFGTGRIEVLLGGSVRIVP